LGECPSGYAVGVDATAFDHVALWVDQRVGLETVIAQVSGMHEIERTDSFTLLGGDARGGKITLFDAEGPREQGCLHRLTIRVPQIAACRDRLEALTTPVVETGSGEIRFLAPGGVPIGLVEGAGEPDLHSIVLTVHDPAGTAERLRQMGFKAEGDGLALGGRFVTLRVGSPGRTARPLLNHLALLVDSAEGARREAEELGLGIDRVVDAANTVAVFVMGPEGILLEYVEHKPSFSLV
jgi:catechol 2,3-dioxygenase-like lactoylglutathione lyase family enzyme